MTFHPKEAMVVNQHSVGGIKRRTYGVQMHVSVHANKRGIKIWLLKCKNIHVYHFKIFQSVEKCLNLASAH